MTDARKHRRYFEQRISYTGETRAQAVQCARANDADVPLIPPAATFAQADFEANVLRALGKSMLSGARVGQPQQLGVDRGAFGIIASLPTRNGLTLVPSRHPATFSEFVARLITVYDQAANTAHGVSGLRLRFTHSNTVLVDTIRGARITIRGTRKSDWEAAIADNLDEESPSSLRAVVDPDDTSVNDCYINSDRLNPDIPQDHVAAHLLSGILRRARLFHTSDELNFVDLWDNTRDDSTEIQVEWSGLLPHGEVIDRIVDPVFGLAFRFNDTGIFSCVCDPCLYLYYDIPLYHAEEDAVIHLRRSDLYDAGPSPRKVCQTRGRGPLVDQRMNRWQ
ncbi:hypothetical protein [Actinokineospora spheciospongiae]|uniref:hypothetical protein n=1 Tax=Actinokineospora spheciospongiae TaxID=909613 RepID=UPI0012680A05|nr:hypothetical protein [Actinokineospora spheciospongiae]